MFPEYEINVRGGCGYQDFGYIDIPYYHLVNYIDVKTMVDDDLDLHINNKKVATTLYDGLYWTDERNFSVPIFLPSRKVHIAATELNTEGGPCNIFYLKIKFLYKK